MIAKLNCMGNFPETILAVAKTKIIYSNLLFLFIFSHPE